MDVSTVLSDQQITQLLPMLNEKPEAERAAARLTAELQKRSLLNSNERVVGVSRDGTIYKMTEHR